MDDWSTNLNDPEGNRGPAAGQNRFLIHKMLINLDMMLNAVVTKHV